MEERYRDSDTLVRGASIIVKRARVYGDRYKSIHVFGRNLVELDTLVKLWGGSVYPHGTGFTWMLGHRTKQLEIVSDLQLLGFDVSRLFVLEVGSSDAGSDGVVDIDHPISVHQCLAALDQDHLISSGGDDSNRRSCQ